MDTTRSRKDPPGPKKRKRKRIAKQPARKGKLAAPIGALVNRSLASFASPSAVLTKPTLMTLPMEIKLQIFSHLQPSHTVCLGLTSRVFYPIFRSLRYHVKPGIKITDPENMHVNGKRVYRNRCPKPEDMYLPSKLAAFMARRGYLWRHPAYPHHSGGFEPVAVWVSRVGHQIDLSIRSMNDTEEDKERRLKDAAILAQNGFFYHPAPEMVLEKGPRLTRMLQFGSQDWSKKVWDELILAEETTMPWGFSPFYPWGKESSLVDDK